MIIVDKNTAGNDAITPPKSGPPILAAITEKAIMLPLKIALNKSWPGV